MGCSWVRSKKKAASQGDIVSYLSPRPPPKSIQSCASSDLFPHLSLFVESCQDSLESMFLLLSLTSGLGVQGVWSLGCLGFRVFRVCQDAEAEHLEGQRNFASMLTP